jgi:phosphotransferase system IIB component
MSSRLRSLDSKISFFAFADIITAVSGVLIFVALLLATDLGRPTNSSSQAANSELEQRLQETFAQQAEVDAQNHRLQELLASADTAPNLEKLQADITRLRSQLSEEQKKQAAVADQMADSQATIAARDKVLGLTDLKATVQRVVQEVESIARQDAKARSEMGNLDQQVAQAQSKLLKLRQREGQLWLIPDKSSTTKEPILVTVAGAGVTVERFDHPDQRKQLEKSDADTAFRLYLREAKALDQYVVFLVRPSGIETFQDLVKSARDMGFDVGYDALEEDRQIHFSTPPAVDDSTPPTDAPATATTHNSSASNGNSGSPANAAPAATPSKPNKPQPAAAPSVPSPQKEKGWWQKLLEWAGLG